MTRDESGGLCSESDETAVVSKKSQNPASRHESCSKSSPYYCPFLRALAVPVQMNLQ